MEATLNFDQPKSLVEQVCDSLTTAIIEGKLKPGELLKENRLSKDFCISRSPIREVLRILGEKGLVTILPRKGAYVKNVTKKDIMETLPVRALLEGYAARLAAENITEEDLEELSRSIQKMESVAKEGDFLTFWKFHYEFHKTYIRASNNDVLQNIIENLLNKAIWFRYSFLYFHEAYEATIEKHKEILDLFRKRDKDEVESHVRSHIEIGMKDLLHFIDK